MLDAESSVRGFLLAGDDRELATWRSARAALPRATDRLVAQLAEEPRQAASARAIRTDVASYLDDYATPVIARAQSGGVGAGRALRDSLQGGGRSESLRGRLATLALGATAAADARQADADAAADRAKTLAICGLIGFVALLGVAALLITRRVALPVRDLARAADRVRDGDFDVEVPVRSSTEVGQLTESFNAMTRSLARSRDELESQNAELEARQTRLTDAGEELRAQRDELEATAEQLAEEKRLAELFGEFAERLAAESDVHALAPIVLETIADVTGAPAGVLYGPRREGSDEWTALAVHGMEEGAVPARVAVGGEGDGARAVASGHPRSVAVASGLELHVPLLHGVRPMGLITLRRAFAASEPADSGGGDSGGAAPDPADSSRVSSGAAAASSVRAASAPAAAGAAASGPAAAGAAASEPADSGGAARTPPTPAPLRAPPPRAPPLRAPPLRARPPQSPSTGSTWASCGG